MVCEPLHLLMVEDSEEDTLLLMRELTRQGFISTHLRVETEADFLAALKSASWDAVIADYVLPKFSGPAALECLRHTGSDLPFIMISGIYGEEAAVAMIKAGANDYLMKGNLGRLGSALERELAAAENRRRLKNTENATQFLAAIVASSEDAIYGKNLDSLIVSWNPAAERIYGYTAAEIIGKSIVPLFPLNRRDELLDNFAAVRRGETVGILNTERRHKNGEIIPVSVIVSPIWDAGGKIIGASTIARDIRRQKQAEREREQLIESLSEAASHVRRLAGMLPICAACKRIRDDQGYWQQVETYISKHADVIFSHGLCPICIAEYERQSDLKVG